VQKIINNYGPGFTALTGRIWLPEGYIGSIGPARTSTPIDLDCNVPVIAEAPTLQLLL
jgi:hypothetical protein